MDTLENIDLDTWQYILDSMPNPVTLNKRMIEKNGTVHDEIVYLNKAFLNTIGYTLQDIPTDNVWFEKAYPEDSYRKYVFEEWFRLLKIAKNNNEDLLGFPAKVKCKDGVNRWFQITTNINYNIADNYHLIVFVKIQTPEETIINLQTIAKQLNKNILEKQTLVNSYDKHVIFSKTDLKGIITHVSDAFCHISGYAKEELIGQPHNIVRHPDMPSSVFKSLWEQLEKNIPVCAEIKNMKKDGGYYWVKSCLEPEYDIHGEKIGYTSVRFDITSEKEVQLLHEEIESTQKEIIFTMGSIGESRSKETGNHVKRVAEYSKILALHYGIDEEESELLRQASPMHDIGKIGIPDSILNKPGRLTDDEMIQMKKHAAIGFNMLKHPEKWDGTGYPQGLVGENIHIYGRITALADVFDALGNDRCYKKAWDDEKIFALLKEEKGKHFDPQLVDIFFDNLDSFLSIRDNLQD